MAVHPCFCPVNKNIMYIINKKMNAAVLPPVITNIEEARAALQDARAAFNAARIAFDAARNDVSTLFQEKHNSVTNANFQNKYENAKTIYASGNQLNYRKYLPFRQLSTAVTNQNSAFKLRLNPALVRFEETMNALNIARQRLQAVYRAIETLSGSARAIESHTAAARGTAAAAGRAVNRAAIRAAEAGAHEAIAASSAVNRAISMIGSRAANRGATRRTGSISRAAGSVSNAAGVSADSADSAVRSSGIVSSVKECFGRFCGRTKRNKKTRKQSSRRNHRNHRSRRNN